MDNTSPRLSALKMSSCPWTRVLPIWNHFARLTSSWLTRSAYSVPGGTSGTFSCAALMFGITSAPGVHGPMQSAAYLLAGVISQTGPAPGGVTTFGSAVGDGMLQLAMLQPSRYPGMLWNEPLTVTPYGKG